jgi:hypothetical protein
MDTNDSLEQLQHSGSSAYAAQTQLNDTEATTHSQRLQLEKSNEYDRAENSAINNQSANHNQGIQYEANPNQHVQDSEDLDSKFGPRKPHVDGMESFEENKPKLTKENPKDDESSKYGKIVINKETGLGGWKPPDWGKSYWIPGYHIHSGILHREIHSLAGPRATFRSLTFKNQKGFLIEAADNVMSNVSDCETHTTNNL